MGQGRRDERPRGGRRLIGEAMAVFEVFRQDEPGEAYRHVGNVVAPDPGLAEQYARDIFSRRKEALRLWVVPRDAVRIVEDADVLRPPLDRSYREGAGYRGNQARRRALRDELVAGGMVLEKFVRRGQATRMSDLGHEDEEE